MIIQLLIYFLIFYKPKYHVLFVEGKIIYMGPYSLQHSPQEQGTERVASCLLVNIYASNWISVIRHSGTQL
jgi:hypothetical protein